MTVFQQIPEYGFGKIADSNGTFLQYLQKLATLISDSIKVLSFPSFHLR